MTIAFYMDENVHRGITDGLRMRGVDVITVQEDKRIGFSDILILDRANELTRVLFSQDDDFLVEAKRRQLGKIDFIGIIYAHKLKISVGDCIRDLEIIAKAASWEELANSVQYLPL
ncbi:DUF5615 family PIN-like protein [Crocosphaera chwakensis]|uniref:DUF5615 domain-containing protein n=1 Tax=Crocosphaera chwakensis CCY0110 TaxID=391612 RepID=A3IZN2_9CHRO|nr:DUF5615 family PIN-like protein [Crocosphaera chwakensis]EAZ88068.1 hypothetical protein CY0110_29029 [Crocosphaera chwakensis CCY0110]